MAKQIPPFDMKYQINVTVGKNGEVSGKTRGEVPSYNFLNEAGLKETAKGVKDFLKYIKEIKNANLDLTSVNTQGLKVNSVNLTDLESKVENFTGSQAERQAIIKDFIEINKQLSLMKREGNEVVKAISDSLSKSLRVEQGLPVMQSSSKKAQSLNQSNFNESRKPDKNFLTKKVDRVEKEVQEETQVLSQTVEQIDKKIKELRRKKEYTFGDLRKSGIDIDSLEKSAIQKEEQRISRNLKANKEEGKNLDTSFNQKNVDLILERLVARAIEEKVDSINALIQERQKKISMLNEQKDRQLAGISYSPASYSGQVFNPETIAKKRGFFDKLPSKEDYEAEKKWRQERGDDMSKFPSWNKWISSYKKNIIATVAAEQKKILDEIQSTDFRNLTEEEANKYERLRNKKEQYEKKIADQNLSLAQKETINRRYKLTSKEEAELAKLGEVQSKSNLIKENAKSYGFRSAERVREENTQRYAQFVEAEKMVREQAFLEAEPISAEIKKYQEEIQNLSENFKVLSQEITPMIKSLESSREGAIETNKPTLFKTPGQDFVTNDGTLITGWEQLNIGGRTFGSYEKEYNRYQKNLNLAYNKRKDLFKGAGVKSTQELELKLKESPDDENLKSVFKEVKMAETSMQDWAERSKTVVQKVIEIFENSTPELQSDFLRKLNLYENISPDSEEVAKAAGMSLDKIPKETRKNIAKILSGAQAEGFGYAIGRHASPLKEQLFQGLKSYQYDFSLDSEDPEKEINYGMALEPWEQEERWRKDDLKAQNSRQEQEKEAEYFLQSSLNVFRSNEFQEILRGENGIQIASNLIKQIFGELENAISSYEVKEELAGSEENVLHFGHPTIESSSFKDQEVFEVFNEDMNRGSYKEDRGMDAESDSTGMFAYSSDDYRQFLAERENDVRDPLQEPPKETIAFKFREGILDILKSLEATPSLRPQVKAISSQIGELGIERGEMATTVEEDERQIYQRISKLLTFADTVDRGWQEISKKRGISIEEIQEDAFKDEYFKSRYEESAQASEIWQKMGGASDPYKALQTLFGVPKEKSELYKNLPTNEVNNIFNAISRLKGTGSISNYKNGEYVGSIVGGLEAVFTKTIQRMAEGADSPDKRKAEDFYSRGEYKGIEIKDEERGDYSPAERTALFYKGGLLAYEAGATNLKQARENAEKLLAEEVQRITEGLGEGETFQDSVKSSRLKTLIQEIDALKRTEAEIYHIPSAKKEVPLAPTEEKAETEKAQSPIGRKTEQNIQKETEAFREENAVLEGHVEQIDAATIGEKNKVLVSSELAKKLKEETQAIEDENKALGEHADVLNSVSKESQNFDGVRIEFEPAQFLGPTEENKQRHEYRSLKTGEKADFTATEVAGLAFSGNSTQSKEDFKKISDALHKAYITGEDFSPQSLGILDKNTGKPDNKQWDFIKRGQESTLRGTMLHKVAELAAKYQTDTIASLESVLDEGDSSEFKNLLEETFGKMKILGSDFSKDDLQKFLTAYMDALFPKDANGDRNIKKPLYSESPMIAKISKGGKGYSVGMSPDEIFLNNWLMATDIKTGKISPEKNSFQLALNARTFQEAVKTGAFPGISPDVLKKDLELSIIHYAEDVVTKIIYGLMPDEQIFEVVDAAAQGKTFSSEEKKRYNYESSVGRVSSRISGREENEILSGDDREIYKAILGDIKKIQEAKKQIAILDVAIDRSSGEVKSKLEQQKINQKAILEAAEQAYDISKAQLQLDKTKGQLLENERQRAQRVDLSEAEIGAAAERKKQSVEKGVVDKAFKNYKESNKAVYDQQIEVERAKKNLADYAGNSQIELKALEKNLKIQQDILYTLEQQQAVIEKNKDGKDVLVYYDELGQQQEIILTQEQVNRLKQIGNKLEMNHEKTLAKVNAKIKESKSLFDQLVGGLKRSLTNLIDYSLAGEIVGQFRMAFSEAIMLTQELDKALTDLQIAAGTTREETTAMLKEYNDLASTLGRTTQEVAIASNDWLRAGYQGQEAAELTEASMQLSTLGMTDAASATTNLISVMKGWKLEAEDVGSVVDKLTVIICGVCRVIGTGHEPKCR